MSLLKLKSLREPRANQISTSIFFHSPKIGRQIWCESNLEWDTAIALDYDPFVLDYCEQSIELHWSKSKWIPDFVALVENKGEYHILILEVKYLQELLEDKEHFIQKYDETQEWILQNFKPLANQITSLPVSSIELIIATDQSLQQSFRVRNCRKLIQAMIENNYNADVYQKINDILSGINQIQIKSLVNSIQSLTKADNITNEAIYNTIFYMIYTFDIQIDVEKLLLPKTLVFKSNKNYVPFEDWIKKFNWQSQTHYNTPLIKHQDLYFIARTPEKSIEHWEIAARRLKVINPLLELSIKELKRNKIEDNGIKIQWFTAYDWVLKYRAAQGDIRSLLPDSSKSGRKKCDLEPFGQELWEYGKAAYLKRERKSIQGAYNTMQAYAFSLKKGTECMSYSSFYRRIQELHGKEVATKRIGQRNAEKDFELTESEFPHADFPLQSVQIDHTPIDVLVVDEENRQVTERPYITVAFDSFSRCILGYHVTYNDPSRLSIAMTLLNCVQDKTDSIQKIQEQFPDLDEKTVNLIENSKWRDVYGLPYTLHMDNGSDFRSHDVRLFGISYKVHLHYRAVKKPQHGAYVERFLGTLNNRLHSVAGTTYSNTVEKREYPSEKRATYTIKELDARILSEILFYHEDYHQQIRMPPIRKWQDAFERNGTEPALTRNLSHINFPFFHLDILPSEMRSVQKRGVQMFNLNYAHPSIQKWIGTKESNNKASVRKFLIRYDPRDIRTVYFYDPQETGYLELKCNDRFVQTYYQDQELTLWQWAAIKKNYKREYRHGSSNYEDNKRGYILIQEAMDKEVATRSKSARIKRSRHISNQQDRSTFVIDANLSAEDNEALSELDASLFALSYDKDDVEYVYIPPEQQNPFYGIEEDITEEEKEEWKK